MEKQDIVLIGASAGGIEALSALVAKLSPDIPASIFVVVHLPVDATSVLPQILNRRGPLPAVHATDGMSIEKGKIYVAPPDFHLLLGKKRMQLFRGPREHGVRPAVDPLFRSAALAFGPNVLGIVLSGNLDDGTAGLEAIKAGGGRTIVQDPGEALYSGMVESAMSNGVADQVLSVAGIATALNELLQSGDTNGAAVATDKGKEREEAKELAIDKLDFHQLHGDDQPGVVSTFTCPDCHGALWELTASDTLRYRCRVGHAYAVDSLLSAQKDGIEAAFWIALRSLEERGALLRRLTTRAQKSGSKESLKRYTEEEKLVTSRAKTLRDVILSGILTDGPGSLNQS
jgi:two-component system, chemotaxis family, protein-glutamate methylesterase/glutaminase